MKEEKIYTANQRNEVTPEPRIAKLRRVLRAWLGRNLWPFRVFAVLESELRGLHTYKRDILEELDGLEERMDRLKRDNDGHKERYIAYQSDLAATREAEQLAREQLASYMSTSEWYASLDRFVRKPEILNELARAEPTEGLVRVFRQMLTEHYDRAIVEASDPRLAGKPEAIHAAGGAYHLNLLDSALVALLTEAERNKRETKPETPKATHKRGY